MSYLGFDIGGTNIKIGLFNENKELLHRYTIPTLSKKEDILHSIDAMIEEHFIGLQGVGFSVPGFVNDKGDQVTAGAIGALVGYNLKEHVEKKYNIPSYADNDVNCVILCEHAFGNGKGCQHLLAITIGTGIGGGIIINNQIYRGANFAAGEFGFMIVNGVRNNLAEECGLSRISAIHPIREKYARIKQLKFEDVTGEMVFLDKDPRVQYIVEEFKEAFVLGLYNLFYSFNPEKIVIGGAISADPLFIECIREGLKKLPCDPNVSFEIEACLHHNDAGIMGAVSQLGD